MRDNLLNCEFARIALQSKQKSKEIVFSLKHIIYFSDNASVNLHKFIFSELDISRYQQTAFVTRDVFASSVLLFTYTSLLSWLVALGHSFRETRVNRQQREGLLRILSQNAIIPRITCICNYQFARLVNNVIMPLLILKSLTKRRASNS